MLAMPSLVASTVDMSCGKSQLSAQFLLGAGLGIAEHECRTCLCRKEESESVRKSKPEREREK